jgi:TolA-binding protein
MSAARVDLSQTPLDEVLEFRESHSDLYRSYIRNLEKTVIELSRASPEQQDELLRIRQEEIENALDNLRRTARGWRKPLASLGIGLAGATWSALHGQDLVGAALAALGALAGMSLPRNETTAFSYVITAGDYHPPVRVGLARRT